jgi:hypothetical protein
VRVDHIRFAAGSADPDGSTCGLFLKIAAEIKVMATPTGKGSMNVIAALGEGPQWPASPIGKKRRNVSAKFTGERLPRNTSFEGRG